MDIYDSAVVGRRFVLRGATGFPWTDVLVCVSREEYVIREMTGAPGVFHNCAGVRLTFRPISDGSMSYHRTVDSADGGGQGVIERLEEAKE